MTFGAPMVLYGEDAPTLYTSLQKVGSASRDSQQGAQFLVYGRACLTTT